MHHMELRKNNLYQDNQWLEKTQFIDDQLKKEHFATINLPDLNLDGFLRLSYGFGEVIKAGRETPLVTEIKTNRNYGNKELELHNDKTYWAIPPRYEMLYIVEANGMTGGDILKSSILDCYLRLSIAKQKLLRETDVEIRSPNNRDGSVIKAPLVNYINENLAFFRCRADIINADSEVKEIFNELYSELINNTVAFPAKTGDLFIFDNWLAAHGRSIASFNQDGYRLAFRTLVI